MIPHSEGLGRSPGLDAEHLVARRRVFDGEILGPAIGLIIDDDPGILRSFFRDCEFAVLVSVCFRARN